MVSVDVKHHVYLLEREGGGEGERERERDAMHTTTWSCRPTDRQANTIMTIRFNGFPAAECSSCLLVWSKARQAVARNGIYTRVYMTSAWQH